MPRVIPLLLLLAAAFSSCEPEPTELVEIPPEQRAKLFGHVDATDLVRQEIARPYGDCWIEFSGNVCFINGAWDSSPWPVWMSVGVPGTLMRCDARFDSSARRRLLFLQRGDSVTVVGRFRADRVGVLSLKFYACKLIRAERDGKQIYPPEGDSPDREAGGEK